MLPNLDSSTSSEGGASRTFKVTVLGDGSVGKSSICSRFCKDLFAQAYKQTIGLDFFSQVVSLEGGEEVIFNLYDIGGQSLGSRMLPTYLKGSDAVIYVYDMTNVDSLENVLDWHAILQATFGGAVPASVKRVLVGNKSDLASLRTVRSSRAEEIANVCGCYANLTASAKTGDRINLLFISLAGQLAQCDVTAMMIDLRRIANPQVPSSLAEAAEPVNQLGAIVGQGDGVRADPITGHTTDADIRLIERVRRRVRSGENLNPPRAGKAGPASKKAAAAEEYATGVSFAAVPLGEQVADGAGAAQEKENAETDAQLQESIKKRGRCVVM